MSIRKTPKRRSSREIRRQLRSIYEGSDGRVPDLSKLDRGKRSRLTQVLLKTIGLLAVLSLIAWVGFFVFTKGLFQEGETLKLTTEGPGEVKSGEEISYTFRYENIGDVPVASLVMKLTVPSTFHVYSSVPEPQRTLEWTIGSLSAGSDGAITVTGVFLAEVPSSQRLQALFTYKPANFSSDFQDILTQKIDIEDSVVALSFTGPEKALAGDTSEYVVNVQNSGSDPVYNIRVIPTFPTDFTSSSSEPPPVEGQMYWVIDVLEPGELSAITIDGSFTSTASGEQKMVVAIGFVDQDLVYLQDVQELVTDVLGGSIIFSVIVNGSNQSQTADLGETLRISLDYANQAEETARDMSFAMTLSSEAGTVPVDWSKANLSGGVRVGNEVSWEGLAQLAPENSSVIDLSLPIYTVLDPGEADSFTIAVVLTLGNVGTITSTRTLEATPIVITLNSDVSINAQATYYSESGMAIGSGPIPPQVGHTTNYRVYWNVSNSLHTLENVRMSATLPQDVAWLERTDTDIGTVSYNATTRQITWTIPKLLAELAHAGAWFEIAISPDSGDVGRFMKLTSTTSFEARDSSTAESMSESLGELTSELPDDDFALGKGIVTN
ncbi:MAG: hypothetical protein UY76_C0003G0019 [Candidatus Uhrbacteria bacterium GW2011_GWA2_52_8d]|uniref:DUF11 domain-containing protein n=1 Tax=Candidatus Uhrbacteria bacterium GW2011_GWA2_52_8d TaxID=1618979 RepID=A0A0G2ALA1_9BACT|nr:MAG: hypothetical protein UY76_C0003G0019 [Candidatus Uhrbacteria bacterium GW2011_GWA2_52_8d]